MQSEVYSYINNKFSKQERLCSLKDIEKVIASGKSFLIYPYRVTYLIDDYAIGSPSEVVLTVGKRKFKSAVKRNLIKRKMREVFRLHKKDFYESLAKNNKKVYWIIAYQGKVLEPYLFLCNRINLVFKRMQKEIQ